MVTGTVNPKCFPLEKDAPSRPSGRGILPGPPRHQILASQELPFHRRPSSTASRVRDGSQVSSPSLVPFSIAYHMIRKVPRLKRRAGTSAQR